MCRWGVGLLALAAVGSPAGVAAAQSVMVASPAVVIDGGARTGAMTLINDGIEPVEVTMSAFCGYPVTDSLGRMYLRTLEQPADTVPCAAPWVQSFPRRLRVAPKSRATVRLLITPPPGTAKGEYWARIMASARAGSIPLQVADSTAIQASLAVEIRSVVALFYRQGELQTGVEMASPRAAVEADSVVGRVLLTRRGEAAFVGSLKATLRDERGRSVAESLLPLGVYYSLEPRFSVPVEGLAAGSYQLVLEAMSSRPDLPAAALLATLPVRRSIGIQLP